MFQTKSRIVSFWGSKHQSCLEYPEIDFGFEFLKNLMIFLKLEKFCKQPSNKPY